TGEAPLAQAADRRDRMQPGRVADIDRAVGVDGWRGELGAGAGGAGVDPALRSRCWVICTYARATVRDHIAIQANGELGSATREAHPIPPHRTALAVDRNDQIA